MKKHEKVSVKPAIQHDRQRDSWYKGQHNLRERRTSALFMLMMNILWEAWRRVRDNKGEAGIDGETLADIVRIGYKKMRITA